MDEPIGMNGGFEVTSDGLPVNWLLYTPATIPTGDYDLVMDTVEYMEGGQSLKFVVRECSSIGGWHSPGFSREYEATAGVTYRVGMWVRNDGSRFQARVGGDSWKSGEYEMIVETDESMREWRYYEHQYTIPEQFRRLRLEVNVLSPGTFWIDDITITAMVPEPSAATWWRAVPNTRLEPTRGNDRR